MTIKTEPQTLVEEIARLKHEAEVINDELSIWQNLAFKSSSQFTRDEAVAIIEKVTARRDCFLRQALAKEAELKRLLEITNDY